LLGARPAQRLIAGTGFGGAPASSSEWTPAIWLACLQRRSRWLLRRPVQIDRHPAACNPFSTVSVAGSSWRTSRSAGSMSVTAAPSGGPRPGPPATRSPRHSPH
jgi:hypothetical protein